MVTNRQEKSEHPEDAWTGYRTALEELYRPAGASPRERGDLLLTTDELEERLDAVADRSDQLHAQLIADMTTDRYAQRELAALKLLAAAAYDLSVAADAAITDEYGIAGNTDRAATSEILTDPGLRRILDAPAAAGVPGLGLVDRRARPSDPAEALGALREVVADFLETIPDRTASAGMGAVGGLAGMHVSAFAALSAQEILARLPSNISGLLRRAARLVIAALVKMQAAIGADERNEVREQASGWLKELGGEANFVRRWMSRLYEIERIEAETDQLMAKAAGWSEADRFNDLSAKLEDLLAKHAATINVTNWVLRALALAKGPLMGVAPWGPLAVGAGYTGTLGYVIYIGGDYLDWYRLGDARWLDRVKGLRSTLQEEVAADGH
jgi:hypothetical protein